MKITQGFKNAIANSFYDKTVILKNIEDVVQEDGFAGVQVLSNYGSFKANVRSGVSEEMQKQYGLKEKMDITVTTDQEIDIASILEYADKSYRIEQVIPFDSHYLLFCKEWQSKF